MRNKINNIFLRIKKKDIKEPFKVKGGVTIWTMSEDPRLAARGDLVISPENKEAGEGEDGAARAKMDLGYKYVS